MPSAMTTKQVSWHNRLYRWRSVLRVTWLLSIFLISYLYLLPKMDIPYSFSGADKLGHFLAYLWLGALPFLSFIHMKRALAAAVSMIILGGGLELAQHWVPGRHVSAADMLANTAGVGMGIFLFRNIKKVLSS